MPYPAEHAVVDVRFEGVAGVCGYADSVMCLTGNVSMKLGRDGLFGGHFSGIVGGASGGRGYTDPEKV